MRQKMFGVPIMNNNSPVDEPICSVKEAVVEQDNKIKYKISCDVAMVISLTTITNQPKTVSLIKLLNLK